MKYRGAPGGGTYRGVTGSYRGAPTKGTTGYYKGKPMVTTSTATTTLAGTLNRPVMGRTARAPVRGNALRRMPPSRMR